MSTKSSDHKVEVRVEASVRELSIRIYIDVGERKSDNYSASCSLFLYGNRAYMYNIIGDGFYLGVSKIIQKLKEEFHIKSIEGYVVKAHARLLRIISNKLKLKLDVLETEEAFERELVWVKLYV